MRVDGKGDDDGKGVLGGDVSFDFGPGCVGRLRQARRPGDPGCRRAVSARGTAAKAYEAGVVQRVVIVEFDSVAKATAAHDSTAYQEALKVLGKGADRGLRIVEGVE